jgi:FtsP/CotA-like multicopper oxidase with cupredoxin domain
MPVLAMGGGRRLRAIEERRSKHGLLDTILEVKPAENRIGPGLSVYTRSYEGMMPGPTLRVKRGDTLRITLINNIPPDLPPVGELVNNDINIPHGFNITNLHTHGLNVSPRYEPGSNGKIVKSGDNVFFEVPGELVDGNFVQYEHEIPEDHPDGTYWYHPHKHGSVAFQFMGGMAGGLIIEGPTDRFLEKRGIEEQLFILQQIRVRADGEVHLEHFNDFVVMPQYTVNGQLKPIIRINPGEVQRWRFVHAGMAEHIPLELRGISREELQTFRQLAGDGITSDDLEQIMRSEQSWANGDEVIEFASKKPQTFYQLAHDGITLPELEPVEQIFLASGNRIDCLVKIDKPGIYCLIKPERDQGFLEGPVPQELIAIVLVTGRRKDMDLPKKTLPTPYHSNLVPITDEELDRRPIDPITGQPTAHRILTFGGEFPPGFDPTGQDPNAPVKFPRFTMGGRYTLDPDDNVVPATFADDPPFPPDVPPYLRPRPFDHERVDQVIRHGAVEEWTVLNFTPLDHPFHIHQNPFFVTEIFDPHAPEGNQTTYPNKWQDVQIVPRSVVDPVTFQPLLGKVGSMTFRIRFVGDIATEFVKDDKGKRVSIGDYVLHCHMLDHEDMGMMQRVRVLPKEE